MDVCCTASVVAWEESSKLRNAVVLSRLQATKEGGVDVASVRRITVATGDNTRIDTC